MTTKMKRLLIFENTADDEQSVKAELQAKDLYQVYDCSTTKKLLELAQTHTYDLVLLVVDSTKIDCKQLVKSTLRCVNDTPIVVFSDLDNVDEIEEIQKLGVKHFLVRTWASIRSLHQVIERQ